MSAIIARLMGLLTSVVLARFLGKEGFGEYGVVQGTIAMFGTFAGFGLGLTATKYVAQYRHKDPARAGRILGLSAVIVSVSGGILAVALLAAAPWLAAKTLAAPQLAGGLRIGALLLMLNSLNGAQTGALTGLEAFKVTARLNLYTGMASVPFMVSGVALFGLNGALWGLVASAAATWALTHLALRRETSRSGISITLKGCLQEKWVLWSFSVPAVMSGLLATGINWVCCALLVNQPNGYAEMGVANAANQWFYAFLFIPTILTRSTVPVLSERLSANDQRACAKILRYSIGVNAAAVLPPALIACFLGRIIMGIYGASFADHQAVVVAAIATAAVLAIQIPFAQIPVASGRMWAGIWMDLAWATTFCVGTWVAISYGALGFMSARLIAYVLHTFWTAAFALWVLRRYRSG